MTEAFEIIGGVLAALAVGVMAVGAVTSCILAVMFFRFWRKANRL